MVGRAQGYPRHRHSVKRYGEERGIYSVRRAFNLIFLYVHPEGKSVAFQNPENDKKLFLGLGWITIMKDGLPYRDNILGDPVKVNMPEWLAEKVKLI